MQPLNILFLAPCMPATPVGGMELKSYHIVRRLAEQHNVTLVTMGFEQQPPTEKIRHLENLGVNVIPAFCNRTKALARAALQAYSPLPLEIAQFQQPVFQQAVEKAFQYAPFDVGISFFMRTAEFLKHVSIPKILIAEDCRTLYQKRSVHNGKSLKQMLVRTWEVMKLRSYEPDIVNYFDVTTFVSDADILAMRQQNNNAKYRLLTNGVDIVSYIFEDNQQHRKDLIFFGKLDVWANEVMALKCVHEILPRVQSVLPDTALHIVGASAPPSIKKLVGRSVFLHENVNDIKPFIRNAAVMVHPHAGASGIQNKVLESMALGCPVVTTETGIQGIAVVPGKDVLIGSTFQDMAQHCIRLLQDSSLRATMARSARAIIERDHTWDNIFLKLDAIVQEVVQPAPALVKHHSFTSVE